MPYISASIVIQLMTAVVPYFKRYTAGGFGNKEERKELRKKECAYFLFIRTIIVLSFLSFITLPFNIFLLILIFFISPR